MSLLSQLIEWVLPWLLSLLKGLAPPQIDRVLEIVGPILEAMVHDAEEAGLGRLTPAHRAPYEARIIQALTAAGFLEDV